MSSVDEPERPCAAYVIREHIAGPCGEPAQLTTQGEPRCLAHASRAAILRRVRALASQAGEPLPRPNASRAGLLHRLRTLTERVTS